MSGKNLKGFSVQPTRSVRVYIPGTLCADCVHSSVSICVLAADMCKERTGYSQLAGLYSVNVCVLFYVH